MNPAAPPPFFPFRPNRREEALFGMIPKPLGSARFQWRSRLHRGAEFRAVFADKRLRPIRTPAFSVYRRPNDRGYPRLGLAVSRKAAKKAVDRNRIKRSIRESFRQQRSLPGVDFVVTCSGRSNLKTPKETSEMLLQIWREAAQRG